MYMCFYGRICFPKSLEMYLSCLFTYLLFFRSAGNSSFPTDKVGNDFHSDMEFLVQLTSRYDVLGEEWLNFSARGLYYHYYYFLYNNQNFTKYFMNNYLQ